MADEPIDFFYSDGTMTLTNGSDVVTGTFTAWDPGVLPYDFVFPNNGGDGASVVKEVVAPDQIKLVKPWTGPTLTDVPYFILRWIKHTDPRIYGVRVSDYLTRVKDIPQVATDAIAARDLAQKWATQTAAEVVTGQGYGAKKYADDAAAAKVSIEITAGEVEGNASLVFDWRNETEGFKNTASTKAGDATNAATTATTKAALATTEADRAASYVPSSVAKTITGLLIANHPSVTNKIVVSPGSARDKNNGIDITLVAAMAKAFTPWSAGNDGGLLDAALGAAYSVYHVFVIRNPTTAAVDLLASTSPTAPVMPSGYTQRRRLGMIQTDAATAPYKGLWRADGSFEYFEGIQVGGPDAAISLTSNLQVGCLITNGVKCKWMGFVVPQKPSGPVQIMMRDPDVGVLPSTFIGQAAASLVFKPDGIAAAAAVECWADSLGRIWFGTSPATTDVTVAIYTRGWLDLRDEYA